MTASTQVEPAAEPRLVELATLTDEVHQVKAVEAALAQRRAHLVAELRGEGVPLRVIGEALRASIVTAHRLARKGATK